MSDQMSEDISSVCNLSSDELSFLMDVCNITAHDDSNCHQILLSEISQSQQFHSDIAGFKVPPDPNVFVNGLNNPQFPFYISDFIFDEHFQSNHHDSNIENRFDDHNCDPFPDNVWKNHESNSSISDHLLIDDSLSEVLGLSGCIVHVSNLTETSHNVPKSSQTSQLSSIQASTSSEMPTSLMPSSYGYFYSSGKLIFHVILRLIVQI